MNNSINNFYNHPADVQIQPDVQQEKFESNFEFEMVSSVSSVSRSPYDIIEIILDMVKTGKVDPWDVDVVKVYDEYMNKLKELNEENNLALIGKSFTLATLVNLKSKILNGISISDFEPEPEFDDFDDGYDPDFEPEQLQLPSSNVISFDEVLQRRTSTKLNRNRGVSYKDLIRYITFYEELERKRALRSKLEKEKRKAKNYAKISAKSISDMTQDEYVKELADKMEQNLNKILEREEKIEINELTLLGFSRPTAYIALLYLASYGKFELVQEEFYGDLYVKLPTKKNEDDTKVVKIENPEEMIKNAG